MVTHLIPTRDSPPSIGLGAVKIEKWRAMWDSPDYFLNTDLADVDRSKSDLRHR